VFLYNGARLKLLWNGLCRNDRQLFSPVMLMSGFMSANMTRVIFNRFGLSCEIYRGFTIAMNGFRSLMFYALTYRSYMREYLHSAREITHSTLSVRVVLRN